MFDFPSNPSCSMYILRQSNLIFLKSIILIHQIINGWIDEKKRKKKVLSNLSLFFPEFVMNWRDWFNVVNNYAQQFALSDSFLITIICLSCNSNNLSSAHQVSWEWIIEKIERNMIKVIETSGIKVFS